MSHGPGRGGCKPGRLAAPGTAAGGAAGSSAMPLFIRKLQQVPTLGVSPASGNPQPPPPPPPHGSSPEDGDSEAPYAGPAAVRGRVSPHRAARVEDAPRVLPGRSVAGEGLAGAPVAAVASAAGGPRADSGAGGGGGGGNSEGPIGGLVSATAAVRVSEAGRVKRIAAMPQFALVSPPPPAPAVRPSLAIPPARTAAPAAAPSTVVPAKRPAPATAMASAAAAPPAVRPRQQAPVSPYAAAPAAARPGGAVAAAGSAKPPSGKPMAGKARVSAVSAPPSPPQPERSAGAAPQVSSPSSPVPPSGGGGEYEAQSACSPDAMPPRKSGRRIGEDDRSVDGGDGTSSPSAKAGPSPGAAAAALALPAGNGSLKKAVRGGGASLRGRELDGTLYKIGRKLGSGSFATVYLARHVETRRHFCIKKLDRVKQNEKCEVENEIAVMQRAGAHPNLVSFKGWFRDADDILCLVLGYCEGGTLAALIKGKAGEEEGVAGGSKLYPEEVVLTWFVQLLMALDHLHRRHIIHRDLKPENIFMTKNMKVVKLGDLGIAKQLEGTLELAITCLGTPYYMSPEVIASRPYMYTSDVWSLGCVLYEMASRRVAFEALGLPQLMFKIMQTAYQPLPAHFSRPFQALVNAMLRADPDDRPSTADLLALPIVRKHLAAMATAHSAKAGIPGALGGAAAADTARRLERQGMLGGPAAGRPLSGRARKRDSGAAAAPSGDTPSSPVGDGSPTGEPGTAAAPARLSAAGVGGGSGRIRAAGAAGTGRLRPARSGRDAGGEGGTGRVGVHLVSRARPANEWETGAQYEQRVAQQAEMRFKTREYEQRMRREQVRAQRKERDPAFIAKEAELKRLQELLMEQHHRRAAGAAQRDVLRDLLGDSAAMGGTGAAFEGRPRLGRTAAAASPLSPRYGSSEEEGDAEEMSRAAAAALGPGHHHRDLGGTAGGTGAHLDERSATETGGGGGGRGGEEDSPEFDDAALAELAAQAERLAAELEVEQVLMGGGGEQSISLSRGGSAWGHGSRATSNLVATADADTSSAPLPHPSSAREAGWNEVPVPGGFTPDPNAGGSLLQAVGGSGSFHFNIAAQQPPPRSVAGSAARVASPTPARPFSADSSPHLPQQLALLGAHPAPPPLAREASNGSANAALMDLMSRQGVPATSIEWEEASSSDGSTGAGLDGKGGAGTSEEEEEEEEEEDSDEEEDYSETFSEEGEGAGALYAEVDSDSGSSVAAAGPRRGDEQAAEDRPLSAAARGAALRPISRASDNKEAGERRKALSVDPTAEPDEDEGPVEALEVTFGADLLAAIGGIRPRSAVGETDFELLPSPPRAPPPPASRTSPLSRTRSISDQRLPDSPGRMSPPLSAAGRPAATLADASGRASPPSPPYRPPTSVPPSGAAALPVVPADRGGRAEESAASPVPQEKAALAALEQQLQSLWKGSDDATRRNILGQVWQITRQLQQQSLDADAASAGAAGAAAAAAQGSPTASATSLDPAPPGGFSIAALQQGEQRPFTSGEGRQSLRASWRSLDASFAEEAPLPSSSSFSRVSGSGLYAQLTAAQAATPAASAADAHPLPPLRSPPRDSGGASAFAAGLGASGRVWQDNDVFASRDDMLGRSHSFDTARLGSLPRAGRPPSRSSLITPHLGPAPPPLDDPASPWTAPLAQPRRSAGGGNADRPPRGPRAAAGSPSRLDPYDPLASFDAACALNESLPARRVLGGAGGGAGGSVSSSGALWAEDSGSDVRNVALLLPLGSLERSGVARSRRSSDPIMTMDQVLHLPDIRVRPDHMGSTTTSPRSARYPAGPDSPSPPPRPLFPLNDAPSRSASLPASPPPPRRSSATSPTSPPLDSSSSFHRFATAPACGVEFEELREPSFCSEDPLADYCGSGQSVGTPGFLLSSLEGEATGVGLSAEELSSPRSPLSNSKSARFSRVSRLMSRFQPAQQSGGEEEGWGAGGEGGEDGVARQGRDGAGSSGGGSSGEEGDSAVERQRVSEGAALCAVMVAAPAGRSSSSLGSASASMAEDATPPGGIIDEAAAYQALLKQVGGMKRRKALKAPTGGGSNSTGSSGGPLLPVVVAPPMPPARAFEAPPSPPQAVVPSAAEPELEEQAAQEEDGAAHAALMKQVAGMKRRKKVVRAPPAGGAAD